MCGISGILVHQESAKEKLGLIKPSINTLVKRGPDYQNTFTHQQVALGHARLSIIDTSTDAAQPFTDASGRYKLVFNGEIFNFLELKKTLSARGVTFRTKSDTEVLLYLLIHEGPNCLNQLNGFFALAFFDTQKNEVLLARDRYGIKPLYISMQNEYTVFASEIKALLAFGIPKEINTEALRTYCHLNYIPAPQSIFTSVKKLEQGCYMIFDGEGFVRKEHFYELPVTSNTQAEYNASAASLRKLLDKAVERRLISDVPLGCFLSGGIDSSIITALAAQRVKGLKTFSIGFKDHAYYDETTYAEMVAKKYNTQHETFLLDNNDLLNHVGDLWDYLDEPFADSSALNVYILSRRTRQHVTVALSGDGADELFAGYRKHRAEWNMRHRNIRTGIIKQGKTLFKYLPKSRNTPLTDLNRKLYKYASVASLSLEQRYWRLAGFTEPKELAALFNQQHPTETNAHRRLGADMNSFLKKDVQMVLEGDMLVKADRMSMANSLEIRSPFLDYTLVNFVSQLPIDYKIDKTHQKKILIDSCTDLLPDEITRRPKKGFEVPLHQWFKKELKSEVLKTLSRENIESDGNFRYKEVNKLIKKCMSPSPDDSVARIWGLLCYFKWKEKYFA